MGSSSQAWRKWQNPKKKHSSSNSRASGQKSKIGPGRRGGNSIPPPFYLSRFSSFGPSPENFDSTAFFCQFSGPFSWPVKPQNLLVTVGTPPPEFKKFITSPTLQKPIAFTFAQEKLVIVVLLTHSYNSRLPPSYVPDLAGLPCAPRGTNNGPRAHSRVNQYESYSSTEYPS